MEKIRKLNPNNDLMADEQLIVNLERQVTRGKLNGGTLAFAESVLDQYRRKGKLSDKQWYYIDRILGA